MATTRGSIAPGDRAPSWRTSPQFLVLGALAAVAIASTVAALVVPQRVHASSSAGHWRQRSLVVSDRTGDPMWQEATRRAVEVWNAVGAELRLVWREGGIGCAPEGTTIPVCRDRLPAGWKGATARYAEPDGHLGGARIRVAVNRLFTPAEAASVACHELGHALGLNHSESTASCLAQGSWSSGPDAADAWALRMSHAHRD